MEHSFTIGQSIFLAILIIFSAYFVCRETTQSEQSTIDQTQSDFERLLYPEKTPTAKTEPKPATITQKETLEEIPI